MDHREEMCQEHGKEEEDEEESKRWVRPPPVMAPANPQVQATTTPVGRESDVHQNFPRYPRPNSSSGHDSGVSFEVGACYGCGSFDHQVGDCPSLVRCIRCGREGHGSRLCPEKKLWEFVATMCGAQSEGQAFFFIENVPNANVVKERASLAMITVVRGEATAQQIKQEFQDLFGNAWRCHAKQWPNTQFSMRFPNARKIEEWTHFTTMGMRRANAEIRVSQWDPVVGAKGVLQSAWFRVKHIPHECRSEPVLAYVGSLVGLTLKIDKSSIFKQEYEVPASAEGCLAMQDGHYFNDFLFEREMPMTIPQKPDPIAVSMPDNKQKSNAKADLYERSPKKAKHDGGIGDSSSSIFKSGDKTYFKNASSLKLISKSHKICSC